MKNHFKMILICAFGLLLTTTASARTWKRITIPGAKCGSGLPYSVFLDVKDKSKLLVEFMPGGACWSSSTCYGKNLKTWMFPIPKLPYYSTITRDNSRNHLKDHTALFFPTCTGDVFTGRHVATYKYGIKAHHVGYTNVLKTLEYLVEKKYLKFSQVEEVVLWGASAGAIGALTHTATFDQYLNNNTKRLVVADSPGLHFGKNFWKKFSPKLFSDFENAFGKINLKIDYDDGFVARHMGPAFEYLSHWRIGILQSAADETMSETFGDISKEEHRKLFYGPKGLLQVAAPYPHVQLWTPEMTQHTFLITDDSARKENEDHLSARHFFERQYDRINH